MIAEILMYLKIIFRLMGDNCFDWLDKMFSSLLIRTSQVKHY